MNLMAWIILLLEGLTTVIMGNYLWLRAVRSLAPEFEEKYFIIWFMGPLFSRSEQFTAEGWRLSKLANRVAWLGMAAFVITAFLLFH